MKYIIAIIQPHRLENVLELLTQKEINLVTVSKVEGRGRQGGVQTVYRGQKETGSLLHKVKIEIAVNDAYLQAAIDAIMQGARTGKIGDGKIFVFDLEQTLRVRTGETGGIAIG
jgi:nitrogen regulatory protein P-II 1